MINLPRRRAVRRAGLAVAAVAMLWTVGTTVSHAADWPMLRGDARRSGVAGEAVAPPLTLLWRFTGAPLGNNVAAPSIVGDTVVFAGRAQGNADSGGVVFAADARTGSQKWIFPGENGLRDRKLFTTAPMIHNNAVYIGASDGYLYVLDLNTGRELRKFRTGGPVGSSPIVQDGVLYFGSNDRTLYALDPETGNQAWRTLYKAQDTINSAPVVADSLLFFTTSDQFVHAVKVATGIPRWQNRLPFRYQSNAAIYADNTLYVPSGPRMNAIQPTSGNFRWQRDFPGDILTAPVAADGVVYAVSRNARSGAYEMYALRSNNGREFWEKPAVIPFAPSAAPTISGNVIYVPTNRSTVVAVARDTGEILWQYRIEPSVNRAGAVAPAEVAITAPVSVANGALYVLTDDGTLSAFRADAPDSTAPFATQLYPAPGSSVNGGPGLILAAKLTDPGSGLETSSIKMLLDDKEVGASYDQVQTLAYYRTRGTGKIVDPPLANGRHTVTLTAKDYRGNTLERTWSFVVDNSLPPPSSTEAPAVRPSGITAPGAGAGGQRPGGRGRGGNSGGQQGPGGTPPPPPPGGTPPPPPSGGEGA